ncbi:hypothetical protein RFI_18264 [Reticulomyxa filosa]|uniref:Uncharacterized protein n=1 Tax=Reticulomyxa filosa TaxID=46433 RepID=X6MYV0_RETFI|nr:hypothetical protein RFI_18264 [Reticulomyxa filosa]|eukprot:ETO18976.1 hypothetical protein RFI_18264 [Reticulomyxa filosa]
MFEIKYIEKHKKKAQMIESNQLQTLYNEVIAIQTDISQIKGELKSEEARQLANVQEMITKASQIAKKSEQQIRIKEEKLDEESPDTKNSNDQSQSTNREQIFTNNGSSNHSTRKVLFCVGICKKKIKKIRKRETNEGLPPTSKKRMIDHNTFSFLFEGCNDMETEQSSDDNATQQSSSPLQPIHKQNSKPSINSVKVTKSVCFAPNNKKKFSSKIAEMDAAGVCMCVQGTNGDE